MLKQRVLTATFLGAVIVICIVASSHPVFSLLMGIFIGIASWEWAGLAGYHKIIHRTIYLLLMTALLVCVYFLRATNWVNTIVIFSLIWWCFAWIIVISYQRGRVLIPSNQMVKAMIGCIILIPAWTGLINLHESVAGPQQILLLFVLIWVADSTAFFIGGWWGKRHLASRISPAKSWEGVMGGLVASMLPVLGYVILKEMKGIDIIRLFALCLVTVVFSILGDLVESMFKRNANMKDSGRLLPGHGGVLDRIDSLTSAVPVFVTGVWLLEGRL
ncbi:MAG: phosphatidate cytidylyltransferase [Gammaproteobacteria bacterium]|nr:phosphatidate cytidylyltransferase [Gammaproteobacteria bacterium]